MNIVDFFSAVLKTNTNFDKPLINEYIAYFLDQTKYADSDLSNYLKNPCYMFEQHMEDLVATEADDSEYRYSNLYGFDDLDCKVLYDDLGKCTETSVFTNSDEKPRLIFRLEGLKLESILDRENKLFYRGKALCISNDGK